MAIQLDQLGKKLADHLGEKIVQTARLRVLGIFKIPMLFFVSPVVQELNDRRCVIRIRLNRRTRNHLHSMYIGTLVCGADVAGGLLALHHIDQQAPGKVALIFKDFHAHFLKRPEGHTDFTCEDGEGIAETVRKAIETGERQNFPMKIVATTPELSGNEPVAEFVLTLSLKMKSHRRPGDAPGGSGQS